MHIRGMATALVAIGVATVGPAATAAQAPDAKLVEILASTRKAISRNVDRLTSLTLQATVLRNAGRFQISTEVELYLELPDRFMQSVTATGNTIIGNPITGFNGDRALKAAPVVPVSAGDGRSVVVVNGSGVSAGTLTRAQQQELRLMRLRAARDQISRLMLGWFAIAMPSANVQYSYAGEAEAPDGKAYVIDAKNSEGFAARLFIDTTSQLPLMLTYQGAPGFAVGAVGGASGTPSNPPATIEHALYFSDWRDVDGVRFPHALRRAGAGATNEEWTIGKVRINSKIDPKKFEAED